MSTDLQASVSINTWLVSIATLKSIGLPLIYKMFYKHILLFSIQNLCPIEFLIGSILIEFTFLLPFNLVDTFGRLVRIFQIVVSVIEVKIFSQILLISIHIIIKSNRLNLEMCI